MKKIKVKGMSCQHCVKAVTRALDELDGISDVKVDLNTGEVSYNDNGSVDEGTVRERITKAGYEIG